MAGKLVVDNNGLDSLITDNVLPLTFNFYNKALSVDPFQARFRNFSASPGKVDVLIIPGLGEPLDWYVPFINKLSDAGLNVLGLDWPGVGVNKDVPLSIDDYVAFVSQAVTSLSENAGSKFGVFGHSFGAYSLLKSIPQIKGCISSVILSGTVFSPDDSLSSFEKKLSRLPEPLLKIAGFVDGLSSYLSSPYSFSNSIVPYSHINALKIDSWKDFFKRLNSLEPVSLDDVKDLNVPVLLIRGLDDERFANSLRNAKDKGVIDVFNYLAEHGRLLNYAGLGHNLARDFFAQPYAAVSDDPRDKNVNPSVVKSVVEFIYENNSKMY